MTHEELIVESVTTTYLWIEARKATQKKRLNTERIAEQLIKMTKTSSKLNTISHFDLLSDDNLYSILQFVGLRSYATFATLDTRCKSIFDSHDIPKQTFYGFLSVSEIDAFYESDESTDYTGKKTCLTQAIARGVAYYKNKELLEWSLEKKKSDVFLFDTMCILGTRAGNLDLLKAIMAKNGETDGNNPIYRSSGNILSAFRPVIVGGTIRIGSLCDIAARAGHLNVLRWLQDSELSEGDITQRRYKSLLMKYIFHSTLIFTAWLLYFIIQDY